jgi:predicted membrane metal-binding protein
MDYFSRVYILFSTFPYQGAKTPDHFVIGFKVLLGDLLDRFKRLSGERVRSLENQKVWGEGVVLSYPRLSETNQTAIVKISRVTAEKAGTLSDLKALLKVYTKKGISLLPGESVRFEGVLELPGESRNPGQFDYREYLAAQEVFCLVEALKTVLLRLEERGSAI